MTDQHLATSLRRLPEIRASEGFTAAVLSRVERLEAARRGAERRERPAATLPGAEPRRAGWTLAGALTAAASVAAVAVAVLLALGATDPRPHEAPVLEAASQGAMADEAAAEGGLKAPQAREGIAAVPAGRSSAPGGGSGSQNAVAPAEAPAPPTQVAAAPTAHRPPPQRPVPDARARPAVDRSADAEPSYQLAAAALPAAAADPADRLAALRRERERLLSELAVLRRAVPAERPAELVLGGDESFELVLDLQAGGLDAPAASSGGYQPASLERWPPAPNRL